MGLPIPICFCSRLCLWFAILLLCLLFAPESARPILNRMRCGPMRRRRTVSVAVVTIVVVVLNQWVVIVVVNDIVVAVVLIMGIVTVVNGTAMK